MQLLPGPAPVGQGLGSPVQYATMSAGQLCRHQVHPSPVWSAAVAALGLSVALIPASTITAMACLMRI